jgi:dephospho-CoA kinase
VPVLGIVGGIGSGKSSVMQGLAARQRCLLIDADRIGHQVLEQPTVIEQIVERFGTGVLNQQPAAAGVQKIDRKQLARIVFAAPTEPLTTTDGRRGIGDGEAARPPRTQPLQDLEAITHPRIQAAMREQIEDAQRTEQARRQSGDRGESEQPAGGQQAHPLARWPLADDLVILLDAALLLEAGWDAECDAVVFVETADDVRCQRVTANRGWTKADWEARERSQLPLPLKQQAADVVISNNVSLAGAVDQLAFWLQGFLTGWLARERRGM